ncbi:hypothetical protein C7974DRAFT_412734 [Boeremia exigua]|uniref:uncharacterized protein n=1 Tax=Boeremia exigua TaxID=749465 RepID=UPI001E8D244E|nr:uncharacterized protein C7974DRAFT_412734 [Boeremia exigua]KAH6633760.1 hypothetical protein C7974DRAFT_412734 [Boeremia exigua]
MSRRIAPTARPASRAQTVYFAFGSNLQLGQMASRCPESRYLGRGMLLGYKWQINTRGYANIYESPSDTVEGLCFLLSKADEEKLDRSEGVHMVPSAYEKGSVDVIVYPSSPLIAGRRVHEVNNFIREKSYPSSNSIKGGGEKVKALVYLSHRDIGDGPPKSEYIDRINAGIQDATLLGVPTSYFSRSVLRPLYRSFLATESVPQNRFSQDQRKDTSSGERPARMGN